MEEPMMLASRSRALRLGALGIGALLQAQPAGADAVKEKAKADRRTCAGAHGAALQLEQTGKLRLAREQLLFCAQAPCSGVVRQQCFARYTQMESDIPSVVPLVTGE